MSNKKSLSLKTILISVLSMLMLVTGVFLVGKNATIHSQSPVADGKVHATRPASATLDLRTEFVEFEFDDYYDQNSIDEGTWNRWNGRTVGYVYSWLYYDYTMDDFAEEFWIDECFGDYVNPSRMCLNEELFGNVKSLKVTNIYDSAFENAGVDLGFDGSGIATLYCFLDDVDELWDCILYVDADSVEIIGDYAFAGWLPLSEDWGYDYDDEDCYTPLVYCKSITFEGNVEFGDTGTMPYGAFYHLENVEEVDLGDGYQTIGENAFYRCYMLQSFEASPYTGWVEDSAFYGCWGLKYVGLPDGCYIGGGFW